MSTTSQGGAPIGPGGMPANFVQWDQADETVSLSSSGVAGATTLFVLLVSVVAMGMGADAQRVLLTATLALSIYAMINYSPATGIPIAIGYLALVGAIKRYSIPILGYAAYDPFLVVGPTVVILMFIARISRREVPRDTPLSKAVFALLAIMFLEVFNPLQGGLTLGITGGLFYIVPLLWFYVGRGMGTSSVWDSTLKATVFIAVSGSLYGLYQQFFGFTEIELQWMAITRNDSGLYLGGKTMRVFSFFSSFAEYVQFCVLGSIISFGYVMRKNRMMIIPCAFLLLAVVLSSSRGATLGALSGCCMIWAIQGRNPMTWIPRIMVAVILGILGLTSGLQTVKTETLDDTTATILEHQKKGILAPLDRKSSTGSTHLRQIGTGILKGFQNPLGQGLGVTTIAVGKVSGGEKHGTEFDISDVFVSCGFIGGFVYVYIIGYVLWFCLKMWHLRRTTLYLCAFCLLFSSVGSWFFGARYATTMLVWFMVGCIDRLDASLRYQVWKQKVEEQAAKREAARIGAAGSATAGGH